MRNPKLVKISLDSIRKSFSPQPDPSEYVRAIVAAVKMENDFIYLPSMLLFH
jgi:hypothetical protein